MASLSCRLQPVTTGDDEDIAQECDIHSNYQTSVVKSLEAPGFPGWGGGDEQPRCWHPPWCQGTRATGTGSLAPAPLVPPLPPPLWRLKGVPILCTTERPTVCSSDFHQPTSHVVSKRRQWYWCECVNNKWMWCGWREDTCLAAGQLLSQIPVLDSAWPSGCLLYSRILCLCSATFHGTTTGKPWWYRYRTWYRYVITLWDSEFWSRMEWSIIWDKKSLMSYRSFIELIYLILPPFFQHRTRFNYKYTRDCLTLFAFSQTRVVSISEIRTKLYCTVFHHQLPNV